MNNNETERKTDEPFLLETNLPQPDQAPKGVHEHLEVHIFRYEEESEPHTSEHTIVSADMPEERKVVTTRAAALVLIGTLLVLIGGFLVYPFIFAQSVTITIVPTTKKVETTTPLTIATGAPTAHSIPGRVLSPLTMTQSYTIATTGITSQSAQPGHGIITFYNAALYPQTLVAGTLITANDGVQVITDSAITVPAGTLATNGQATVAAHTLTTGPSANIASGDIYGDCCLLKISAQNSAFTGGMEAQTYASVAQNDIDTADAKIQNTLNSSVLAAFQSQVQRSESLVTPPACRPTINSNHQVGEQATQVQVSVTETCTGLSYNTQAFQAKIGQIQAIAHYEMVGTPQSTMQSLAIGSDPGTYVMTVQSTTTWAYQFTSKELATIASHIVGKDTNQAEKSLLRISTIKQVSFSRNGTLPTDAGKIHFLFLTQ